MSSFKFKSACAPVFVPIDKEDNVDFGIISQYFKYLRDNGIKSIFVNGGCGEFSSLTVKERKLVLEKWMKVVDDDVQVVVNVGTANSTDTIELGNHALKYNIYGLVLVPPFYLGLSNETDLLSYIVSIYQSLSRPIPILYYHIPSLTKTFINLPALVCMAKEQGIHYLVAIKYTHFNHEELKELIDIIHTTNSNISIFCGFEPLLQESIDLGVNGCVLAFVNILPKMINDILDKISLESKNKNLDKIKQENVTSEIKAIFNDILTFSVTHKIQLMALLKIATELCSKLPLGPMKAPYAITDYHVQLFRNLLIKLKLITED